MRILYATQATGNGHMARALAIVPELQKYGEVELFVSGTESSVRLPYQISFQKKGISLHYHNRGGINLLKTVRKMSIHQLWKDIKGTSLRNYDLVINDFEPITAWAGVQTEQPVISMSHQASFRSPKTPRPSHRSLHGEWILQHFAPTKHAIGFHFAKYDDFIETPIIRKPIRDLVPVEGSHYLMYLPGYSPAVMLRYLHEFPATTWHWFSRHVDVKQQVRNVSIFPIDQERWLDSLASCRGVITGAGFEGPSEALFLGKKLLVIPLKGQYEQFCNAAALHRLGVSVLGSVNKHFSSQVLQWMQRGTPLQMDYPDDLEDIIYEKVINFNPISESPFRGNPAIVNS